MALERASILLPDGLDLREDDSARALALQVLAIVRRNLGEGTVSDLLQNVIDHFAHLEFTKGESTVQDASARIRLSPISSKLFA